MTEHFHFHRILCTFGLVAQLVKNPPAMQEDPVSIPGSGRALGEGNGNPLQYSCLENPKNRGAWRATVHGTAQSRTRLFNFLSQSSMQLIKNKASLCTDAQQWKEQTAQQYVHDDPTCAKTHAYTYVCACLRGHSTARIHRPLFTRRRTHFSAFTLLYNFCVLCLSVLRVEEATVPREANALRFGVLGLLVHNLQDHLTSRRAALRGRVDTDGLLGSTCILLPVYVDPNKYMDG